jgi:hypothetical protein
MTSRNSTSETEKDSTPKWLVRILVIVGIGVPVLIELFTFSGLISNHLFESSEDQGETSATESKAIGPSTISTGDTLFVGSSVPLVIRNLQLEIYPDKWVFTVRLSPEKSKNIETSTLIQALHTQNRVRDKEKVLNWGAADTAAKTVTWTLESSERPVGIEFSNKAVSQKGGGATDTGDTEYFKFGHIPANYYK